MMLLTPHEVIVKKLNTISVPELKQLAERVGIKKGGSREELIQRLISIHHHTLDDFMRERYQAQTSFRRSSVISDDDLIAELAQVTNLHWGTVQGELDQKIQREYVRRYAKYSDLIKNVGITLHGEITNYVVSSWYNHWTNVLIEDHIALHRKVVFSLKKIKGLDLFFDNQPFDLKVTRLPNDVPIDEAERDHSGVIRRLYAQQGEQRFGADNRFYIVLTDREHPEKSWELKRDFDFLYSHIDSFLENETVSDDDKITFPYKKSRYSAHAKLLLIVR